VPVALVVLFFALPTRKIVFRKHYDVTPIAAAAEYQDSARLKRAYELPVGIAYAKSPLVYQANGSLCGPTSLVNVLHSFGDESATKDSVLAGTGKCSLGACFMGLTLDELADISTHAGARATILRDLDPTQFRSELTHFNDPSRRYVVNFDRGPLFGSEGGHHSPIGGYLTDEDLVLVLDVNQKYKPWLVRADRLYDAINTFDSASGHKRGLLLLTHQP